MSTIFGQELPPEQQMLAENLRKSRYCTTCKNRYTDLGNFGTFQCHGYHPRPFIKNGVYPCCNQVFLSDGCVQADHIDGRMSLSLAKSKSELCTPLTNDDAIFMATLLKTDPKQVINSQWERDAKSGVWNVCRVDFAARQKALNKSAFTF